MAKNKWKKTIEELHTGIRVCTGCNIGQPFSNYSKAPQGRNGLQAKCKSCVSIYNYNHRKGHKTVVDTVYNRLKARRYRLRHPEKIQARYAVLAAIRKGQLEVTGCKVCSSPKAEFHHTDGYETKNHLVGVWLCREHHLELHRIKPLVCL